MYQIKYNEVVLSPILGENDAHYWADRIEEIAPQESAPHLAVRTIPVGDDWLTANLPQTNPSSNPRPGAEYGV